MSADGRFPEEATRTEYLRRLHGSPANQQGTSADAVAAALRAELDDAIERSKQHLEEWGEQLGDDPEHAPRSAREHLTYHPHKKVLPERHRRKRSATAAAVTRTIIRAAWPWAGVIIAIAGLVAFGRAVGGV